MSAERTALVTGFEPFGGDATNPSGAVLDLLGELWEGPERLVTALLPVEFGLAGDQLVELVGTHRPTVVISLGLAAGRDAITPERVAVNLDDARIPDNAGAAPIDEPVVAGGPAAYFSTLPVKAIVARLEAEGLPAAMSGTAGSFVCNHVFYRLQHEIAGSGIRAGFVHVPSREVLDVAELARAVQVMLRLALDHEGPDERRRGGAIH